jgi:hypothetical protein
VISATENSNIGFGHLILAYTNIPNSKVLLKKKHSYKTQEIIARLKTLMDFCKEIWKKEKFARGGLEERKKIQEEVWKKEFFFQRRFGRKKNLQEEVWKKEFSPERRFGRKKNLQELFGRKNFARGALQQTIL